MRRAAVVAGVGFAIAVVVAVALGSPYWALDGMREALAAGDVEDLRDHVDFPAVQQSLKEQINAELAAGAATGAADNPFAALGTMLASSIAEKFVESVVTPEGLARIAAGSSDATAREPVSFFQNAETRLVGLDRFEVRPGKAEEGQDAVVFVFRRRGFTTWMLTSVNFAPGWIKSQECKSAQSYARANLKVIYVAEQMYRADRDTYSKSLEDIGFVPLRGQPHYDFAVVSADSGAFLAEARGRGVAAGDIWTITKDNDLKNTTNGCGPR